MKAIAGLICLFLLYACQRDPSPIKPRIEDISQSVYASGIIKSKDQYEVFTSVNGIIKEILVKEGDSVNVGTPLLKIFNKPSALNAKNAQLAAEYASLSAKGERLDELKISINIAKAKMESDSLLWQRQQTLWSQNIGSKVEFEQRELNYKNSRDTYRSAIVRYKDLQRQLEFNAQQSKNTFEINNTLAEEFTIKSEIRGKVFNVLKSKGETTNASSPIALIGNDSAFILELQVDERDITLIRPAQKAFVSMDSHKGRTFEASITKINPVMNGRTKSFTVEAEFVTPPEILYPFLTAEANILIQTKTDAMIIPRSYVVNDSFVITKADNRKKIVTGLRDYQSIEVLSGLSKDEFIIKPKN
jgi:HlyD family secretion protein